jgi:hypothetical protein
MRPWTTELLKECGWATTSALPCSEGQAAVVRLRDPRHFDHIFPFLCPEDIPHSIDLSADDMCKMYEEDGNKV